MAEAHAILQDLAGKGDTGAMIRLAFASMPRDREAGAEWLRRASDAGDAQACWLEAFFVDRVGATYSAADIAEAIDRAEACRVLDPTPDPGAHDYSREVVGSLRIQATRGNATAEAQLDSLRTLGVFERHPRLSDV